MENTLKIVMAGYSFFEKRNYNLVFDSQSKSWYEGAPLLQSLEYTSPETQCFFNGVIYMLAGDCNYDVHELIEVGDLDAFFIDDDEILYRIIGYDVNQDQWDFSILVPASVGFVYCLTEWEGSLFVCASNSCREVNEFQFASISCGFQNEN